ncbi:MAG: hypothetical protein MZV63_51805 [Marinilabiliales bacterium]|nr:hypothetical protein [Marinilabiliales bacterium]
MTVPTAVQNPAMTVAKACTPMVPGKRSMTNPVMKDKRSRIHDGMATGRIRMNIT